MVDVIEIFMRSFVAVLAVTTLTRLNGLRSFSKMSSFDFAITVATGSVIATVVTPGGNLFYGVVALVALFAIQAAFTISRTHSQSAQDLIDNDPLLVMLNGEILPDNLKKARMTKSDLYAKLREANAYDLSKVQAVIFETTGDVSVLHGEPGISPEVMRDVRGIPEGHYPSAVG